MIGKKNIYQTKQGLRKLTIPKNIRMQQKKNTILGIISYLILFVLFLNVSSSSAQDNSNKLDKVLVEINVLDKFEFRQHNDGLSDCVKITEIGDSEYALGSIVPKDALQQTNAQIEALGGEVAKGSKPKPATASTQRFFKTCSASHCAPDV